ncbi:MAG: YgiW/YdeI family stress tolerance OB fold protein [Vibrio sp.]
MKKRLLTGVFALFLLPVSSVVLADSHLIVSNGEPVASSSHSKGGFQGPSKAKHIVRDVISAMNARDENKVELTGKLTMSLGDEEYVFQDATGEITVEIDDDIWFGRTVTPENTIVIRGEVDKDWKKTTIDADSLELVK